MHATQRILASSLVLTLACTSTPSTGEVPEQHALRWNTLTQDRQPPLRYTLVTPEGFDPTATWPVLVALPPGSQAPDMVERCLELYFTAEARSRGWVVVSPAAPEGQNFVQGAEERLPALLDAIAQEIRIEGGGFHLAGVSTGGRSAIRLAGLHPERFLSLSVLPGAASNPQDEERLVGLTTLPVTLYVGELDERWRETTYRLVEQLTALGAKDVLLQEQAGEEHVLSSTVATLLFDRLDSLRPTPAQAATTPEQRFFDWTQLQFPAEVHAARRARLADALRAEDNHQGTGQAVFLSASSEGFSQGETFRQTDDFLYLTGLELPRSILALDVASGETTLFAPTRDARFENRGRPNDFPGRPLAADPALADVSGLEWVRPATELEGALVKWIEEGRPILLHGLARPTVVSRFKAGHSTPGPFARRDEAEALEAYLRTSFPTALLHDASSAVANVRMRKGPEEIELIRRACEVTAAAIRAAAREIRPGVDERTLEGVLEAAFKRGGAQRTAFDSIIKSGPNSLWPWRILAAHYDRRNRAMAAGELVIFDVGCELDHYASDVGRTFPVSGRFSPDQARRLRLVTSITDTIIAAVRPGVTLPELRAVAEAATPPEERAHMQTGTFFGHHIGLDVGDANRLDAPLVPGMVFTIEPWYYDHEDGVAVFLEDVVLVTETGAENLTADLPRSIEELERITGP